MDSLKKISWFTGGIFKPLKMHHFQTAADNAHERNGFHRAMQLQSSMIFALIHSLLYVLCLNHAPPDEFAPWHAEIDKPLTVLDLASANRPLPDLPVYISFAPTSPRIPLPACCESLVPTSLSLIRHLPLPWPPARGPPSLRKSPDTYHYDWSYSYGSLLQFLAPKKPVVIGETMTRVEAAAAKVPGGAKILDDMPEYWNMGLEPHVVTSKMMQYNRKWIHQQLKEGRSIIDIGADLQRKFPSIFYEMEKNMLKNFEKLHPGSVKVTTP